MEELFKRIENVRIGDTFALNLYDVDINKQNYTGRTLLMHAANYNEDEDVIGELITTYAAELDLQDMLGRTALMYAAQYNNHMVITRLIDEGADITIKDKEGKAAWHYIQKNKEFAFEYEDEFNSIKERLVRYNYPLNTTESEIRDLKKRIVDLETTNFYITKLLLKQFEHLKGTEIYEYLDKEDRRNVLYDPRWRQTWKVVDTEEVELITEPLQFRTDLEETEDVKKS